MADKFILGFPISEKTALSELHQDGSKIGISTTSPKKSLQIGDGTFSYASENGIGIAATQNPGISVRDTDSNVEWDLEVGSSSAKMGMQTNHDLYLITNNIARVTVKNGGDVGIGTTNPTADLSVGSTTTSSGDVHLRTTKTAFSMTPSNTDAGGMFLDVGWASGGQGPFRFGIGGNEKMRIDSDGNLGIGVSPNVKLHVLEQTDAAQFWIASTGDNVQNRIVSLENTGADYADLLVDADDIIFRTTSTTSLQERMRILSSGGITFNGDTATANALDDYEEGTWTPSFSDIGNITSLAKVGDAVYTKIGRVVHLSMQVSGSFTSSTTESRFSFTIPFSAYSNTFDNVGTSTFFIGSGADRFGIGSVFSGTTSNAKAFVYIPARELHQSGSWSIMRISFTYFAS